MNGLLLICCMAAAGANPDTVVVCPAEFSGAMEPWLAYRAEQGHEVAVVSNLGGENAVRERIRQHAKGGRLKFVVLVGDAVPASADDLSGWNRCVPVHRAKAEINVLWGSEPHIATDNWYADLDDDRVPDLAIGRLAADTPEQLAVMVAKTLAYERSGDVGPWRHRVNMVAGVGGFGPMADAVIEYAAKQILTQGIPPEFLMPMTYGSWRSPFCPDPRQFARSTLDSLNEGALFWVYVGHGHYLQLDRLRVGDRSYPIFVAADVARLDCRHGLPIAVFLACYTGAMDAGNDCLAELMTRQPRGPVAVYAGSRVTMPYAMGVMGTALMDGYFKHQRKTLGELVLHAKLALAAEPDDDQRRRLLEALAAAVSPARDKLADERMEHVELFNLFGDPLLRLRYPRPVKLDTADKATAGGVLQVVGDSPLDGRATIELVVHRQRLTFRPPPRREVPQTEEAMAAMQEVYRKANDRRLVSIERPVERGQFSIPLDVPREAYGACFLRVTIEGTDDFALGATEVRIELPKSQ